MVNFSHRKADISFIKKGMEMDPYYAIFKETIINFKKFCRSCFFGQDQKEQQNHKCIIYFQIKITDYLVKQKNIVTSRILQKFTPLLKPERVVIL